MRWPPRPAVLVSLTFAAFFLSTAAIGASWSHDLAEPRVTLLGTGDKLSILVTSGSARLLIVSSSDAPSLGNAIERSRHPGLDRIDVLIASDAHDEINAVSRVIRSLDPRYVGIIGSSDAYLSGGIRTSETITSPRQYVLPDDTMVTIDLAEVEDGDRKTDTVWRASVSRGETLVVVFSDPDALEHFPQPHFAALTVLASGSPAETAILASRALAINAEAMRPELFRDRLPGLVGQEGYGIRLHSEETIRFDFVEDGLQLPDEGTIAVST